MEFFKESSIDLGKNIPFIQNAIGNKRFIIFSFNNKIYIYILEKNKAKNIYMKSYPYKISQLKMNPINENIFLTVSNNEINIFEISKLKNVFICGEKIKLKVSDNLEFAKFSEFNENIVGTISNNIIRIWDMNLKFSYLTIKLEDSIIVDFFFNRNENLIMIYSEDINNNELLSIYDILGKKYVKEISINEQGKIHEISSFDFLNILYVNTNYIELINTNDEKREIKKLELNYGLTSYDFFLFRSLNIMNFLY